MSDSLIRRVSQGFSRWIPAFGGGQHFGSGRRVGSTPRDAGTIDTPATIGSISDVTGSLQSAAVWSCCRLISDALCALAVHIFATSADGKVKATSHPYYRLLTTQPNPLMTTPQWIQTTVLHLLLYGNAYTVPEWVDGEVVSLWPVSPDAARIVMLPATAGGGYTHRISGANGAFRDYSPLELLHFRMFSLDGIMGLSPINYHRLSFQLDNLTRTYSSNLYTNGGRPSGVLSYPGNLNETQIAQVRNSWKLMHSGVGNAGGLAVLEGGTKYEALAIPPEQLQFIAQQKYSTEQIARIFGVPPHLIGAMDKPTYASVEQQSLEFVQYRLQPIATMLERTIQAGLLDPPFFYKFNLASFERSDIKTRYAAYAVGRQWGWLSANDVRELEDLNSIGNEGNVYLSPLNMVSAADAAAPEPSQTQMEAPVI